jgi:Ca2+-binding EF-hand superfamily protein
MLEGEGSGVEVGRGSPKGTQERAAEHEAWVEDYLAENDANGDGLIQVAETTGRIRAFFELFDEDADGSLDEGELLGIARRRSDRE